MKYFSEILNKNFDSVEELNKAEDDFKLKEEKALVEKDKEKTAVSKAKKAEAEKVEKATNAVDDARQVLKEVREAARKRINEVQVEEETKIKDAYKQLSVAQEERYNALKEFNEKFGPYKTFYTGEKAYNEFMKELDWFNSFFFPFF